MRGPHRFGGLRRRGRRRRFRVFPGRGRSASEGGYPRLSTSPRVVDIPTLLWIPSPRRAGKSIHRVRAQNIRQRLSPYPLKNPARSTQARRERSGGRALNPPGGGARKPVPSVGRQVPRAAPGGSTPTRLRLGNAPPPRKQPEKFLGALRPAYPRRLRLSFEAPKLPPAHRAAPPKRC